MKSLFDLGIFLDLILYSLLVTKGIYMQIWFFALCAHIENILSEKSEVCYQKYHEK